MFKYRGLLFLFLLLLSILILAPHSGLAATGCTEEYCRIEPGEEWVVSAHGEARLIYNSKTAAIFIPIKTADEWAEFRLNHPLETGDVTDPILDNIATGKSCTTVCSELGGVCTAIGTNAAANDARYQSRYDQYGYETCPYLSGTCGTVMTNEALTCNGKSTMWTNCLCGG